MANLICRFLGHVKPPMFWGYWVSMSYREGKRWGTAFCARCHCLTDYDVTNDEVEELHATQR